MKRLIQDPQISPKKSVPFHSPVLYSATLRLAMEYEANESKNGKGRSCDNLCAAHSNDRFP